MMILPILWGLESWCWPDKWCSDATGACQRFRWWFLGVSVTLRLWVFCHLHLSVPSRSLGADLWSHFPSPGRPPQNTVCKNLWDCTLFPHGPAAVWNNAVCFLVNCVSPSAWTPPPWGWGCFCLVFPVPEGSLHRVFGHYIIIKWRGVSASLSGHRFFSPLISLGVAEKYLLWNPQKSKAGVMHPVSAFDPVYQAMVELPPAPWPAIPTEMWREEKPPTTVSPGVGLEAACFGLRLQLCHSLELFTEVNLLYLSFLICKIGNRNSVTLGKQGLLLVIQCLHIYFLFWKQPYRIIDISLMEENMTHYPISYLKYFHWSIFPPNVCVQVDTFFVGCNKFVSCCHYFSLHCEHPSIWLASLLSYVYWVPHILIIPNSILRQQCYCCFFLLL